MEVVVGDDADLGMGAAAGGKAGGRGGHAL